MRILSLVFLLLFQLSLFCQTNDSLFFVDLMRTELEAYQKKDPASWLKYVDDNAVFTGMDNMLKTKDQIIEEMKNAPDIFLSASESYENVISRIYGNTAVISCLTTFSFTSSNGNLNRLKFKFIRVHIKDKNIWKLVYHSAVQLTENI